MRVPLATAPHFFPLCRGVRLPPLDGDAVQPPLRISLPEPQYAEWFLPSGEMLQRNIKISLILSCFVDINLPLEEYASSPTQIAPTGKQMQHGVRLGTAGPLVLNDLENGPLQPFAGLGKGPGYIVDIVQKVIQSTRGFEI